MIPVNQAQKQLQDLIDSVNMSHQPIVITGVGSNAVLLSEADWSSVQETLHLLSVPGMRESIQEGLLTPIQECDREFLTFVLLIISCFASFMLSGRLSDSLYQNCGIL